MIKILDLFKRNRQQQPIKPPELILLESQIAAASQQHGKWAYEYYLQLTVDGLPIATAAKKASFKFFGTYSDSN